MTPAKLPEAWQNARRQTLGKYQTLHVGVDVLPEILDDFTTRLFALTAPVAVVEGGGLAEALEGVPHPAGSGPALARWQVQAVLHDPIVMSLISPPPAVPGDEIEKPIDMILFCPSCGLQHVDEPERSRDVDGFSERIDWDNPPHRSHLCHGCGFIWRPADVATNGVAAIKTVGKEDSPIISRHRQDGDARDRALEEAAQWYDKKGWMLDESDVPNAIRALKSPIASGQGMGE